MLASGGLAFAAAVDETALHLPVPPRLPLIALDGALEELQEAAPPCKTKDALLPCAVYWGKNEVVRGCSVQISLSLSSCVMDPAQNH